MSNYDLFYQMMTVFSCQSLSLMECRIPRDKFQPYFCENQVCVRILLTLYQLTHRVYRTKTLLLALRHTALHHYFITTNDFLHETGAETIKEPLRRRLFNLSLNFLFKKLPDGT